MEIKDCSGKQAKLILGDLQDGDVFILNKNVEQNIEERTYMRLNDPWYEYDSAGFGNVSCVHLKTGLVFRMIVGEKVTPVETELIIKRVGNI